MQFLNFKTLLENNLHISKKSNCLQDGRYVYRDLGKEYILDLTYTSISLYRLYKFFYNLHNKHLYVTFVNFRRLYNRTFLKLVRRYTRNNFFVHKWISGLITDVNFLKTAFIVVTWISKIKQHNKKMYLPKNIYKIYSKFKFIALDLKFLKFSKFLFFFNLEGSTKAIKECAVNNKFLMGFCSPSFDVKLIDFYIYGNYTNEVSFNFVLRFVLFACLGCRV